MKKRLLSAVLTAGLLLSLLPGQALAAAGRISPRAALSARAGTETVIDYAAETIILADGFELNTAQDFTGQAVADGGSITAYIGQTLYLRALTGGGDDGSQPGEAAPFSIPDRPAQPAPSATDETAEGAHDGTIAGLSAGMEYKLAADSAWSPCNADSLGGLAPGQYQVRVKATGSAFASLPASISIAAGPAPTVPTYTLTVTAPTFDSILVGGTQPEAKPITITSTGNADATITGVTVSDASAFLIGGSGDTVPAGGFITTWTVQPADGLAQGSYTATITVTYNDGAATAQVSFAVTDTPQTPQAAPAAPELDSKTHNAVTLKAIPANENGAEAQYSRDGGAWQTSPTFTGLSASTRYSFTARYAGVTGFDPSPAGPALEVTTDAAPGGSGGGSTGGTPGGGYSSSSSDDTPSTYPPILNIGENGKADVSPAKPSRGQKVTLTPKPDEGYLLNTVTVTDAKGNSVKLTQNADGTYTFTQPSGKVTIQLSFLLPEPEEPEVPAMALLPVEQVELPFFDVHQEDWFRDSVAYAYSRGYMVGITEEKFAPTTEATRGMLVTIFWRLAGSPAPRQDNQFTDVADHSYYRDAISWATQEGIVQGFESGFFGPETLISREQLGAILYRYAKHKGWDMSPSGDLSVYLDVSQVTEYALPAFRWGCGTGLFQGLGDGILGPQRPATRAEIAALIYKISLYEEGLAMPDMTTPGQGQAAAQADEVAAGTTPETAAETAETTSAAAAETAAAAEGPGPDRSDPGSSRR